MAVALVPPRLLSAGGAVKHVVEVQPSPPADRHRSLCGEARPMQHCLDGIGVRVLSETVSGWPAR